jgi:RNA polymerase sigma-70 factor (ECF subfamily)
LSGPPSTRFQDGGDAEHARIERVLREFGARLRQAVRRQCGPDSGIDPEDVEQEVRIRLWRALMRDRSEAAHASYIQKVVVSVVVDAFRRARLRATEPLPEDGSGGGFEGFHDAAADPERQAGSAQAAEVLGQCLAELGGRRRVAVELHLQGHGHVEIAAMLGISDEAVRKLVSRGMEELKELLAARGMDRER